MVGGAGFAPVVHKGACPATEAVAAVRVSYLQGRAVDRFSFGCEEENALFPFAYGEEGDGALFDPHLDRQTFARFAVIDG